MQQMLVQSLVKELRSHMPRGLHYACPKTGVLAQAQASG